MSLKYSSLLDSFIDWTDEEISLGKKFLDWQELTLHWESIELHWEDIFILLEIERKRGGGSGGALQRGEIEKLYIEGNPWRQMKDQVGVEQTEEFIKVLCKIKGVDYTKILENKNNIRVVVNDFIRKENEIKIKVKL
jgi:hypothetical protein